MAELIITHRQRDYLLKMPYQVIISGRPVGVMRTPQAVQMATMERETSETKEINYGIEYTK